MGKPTGFMDYQRAENPYRDAAERLRDFDDLHVAQDPEARREQAARCMNCGVPFCQSAYGCPLHNLIPEWNDLIFRGHDREALKRLLQTAPFPEFTGRVCPALCEKACMLEAEGVTNRDNELYLIETGFENGWIRPRIPARRTGRRVAVVGSGPAGLAAADRLNQLGHSVTVIERADRPGGLLMYGIPNMKLPKEIIQRRVALMEAEGVAFQLNTEADPAALRDYDAVVLCGGARQARQLRVENEHAEGVYFAVDYLTEATIALLNGQLPRIAATGKHVVVVGGGDTGNDCVATALRQGCASVTQLELTPAPPAERPDSNPWPQWPRILRTDYGQQEAIAQQSADPRVFETTVKRVLTDEQGRVTAVETVRTRRDEQGAFVPVPGSEQTIPCELLLIAAGFTGCERETASRFGLPVSGKGTLAAADGSHYMGGHLFVAGDMHTGQSLVVRAIADALAAAREVDDWLHEVRPSTRC